MAKPQVLHRGKGNVQFTVVAFRYDRTTSSGYVWCREIDEVAKQVTRFLSAPNNSDVLSIRRVYVSEEEVQKQATTIEETPKQAIINEKLD